jgi:hypothetical protein
MTDSFGPNQSIIVLQQELFIALLNELAHNAKNCERGLTYNPRHYASKPTIDNELQTSLLNSGVNTHGKNMHP